MIRLRLRIILYLLILMLFTGCASTRQYIPLPDQTKQIENPAKARIYVMRPAKFVGCLVHFEIMDNDENVGITGPRGYLCWEREPGLAKITSKQVPFRGYSLGINVKENTTYYILQYFSLDIVRIISFGGLVKIKLLLPEKGIEILKKCKSPKIVSMEKDNK